ncbi:MAG: large-conductance mechanosensitive channel protein MscL [Anaerolineae bacterium]|nr:large-conductance mechanosensitive channel protein MscL [Anaerolineae bacterium]
MLKEFREFLNRGNVIDLAVAVILGTAFTGVVKSLVDDIIMPLIGILLGGVSFTSLTVQVGDAVVTYGNFIQAIVNFVIIAFVIFLIVRYYNQLARKKEETPATPPAPTEDVLLLREIRDLLKK